MSKFIRKLNNHKEDEKLYNEESYDDTEIDNVNIEEIDKDIEDFYIDKEKINSLKFNFDKESIIKEAIDKAENDIKKQNSRKKVLKIASVVIVILSIGVYSPALAHNMPPIMKVLEKINNTLKVDEVTSFIGVDKFIPRAVINSDNNLKFVKQTTYKVSNEDNEEIDSIYVEVNDRYLNKLGSDYEVVDFIHRMSNQIINPIDGKKNGIIQITPKNIEIALNSLECILDDYAKDYLYSELNKWKNGNFENGVLVHNYVWHMLNGNIGRALSLDEEQVNKIQSKYFK